MGSSPLLGPQGLPIPAFNSFMTDDHSPIEYGLTWSKGEPSVRFSIEAISSPKELESDEGLNVKETFKLCGKLQAVGIGKFGVFRKLAEGMIVEKVDSNLGYKFKDLKSKSQLFLAFDSPKGQDVIPMVKGYLLPHLKALKTNQTNLQVTKNSLQSLGIKVDPKSPWGMIQSYVSGEGEGGLELRDRPELVILSVDCHENEGARLK